MGSPSTSTTTVSVQATHRSRALSGCIRLETATKSTITAAQDHNTLTTTSTTPDPNGDGGDSCFQAPAQQNPLSINLLPTELIIEIFLACLPPPDCAARPSVVQAPLVLCRVCRFWRELALETKQLWTSIDIGGLAGCDVEESAEESISDALERLEDVFHAPLPEEREEGPSTRPSSPVLPFPPTPSRTVVQPPTKVARKSGIQRWLDRAGSLPIFLALRGSLALYDEHDFRKVVKAVVPYCERWERVCWRLHVSQVQMIMKEVNRCGYSAGSGVRTGSGLSRLKDVRISAWSDADHIGTVGLDLSSAVGLKDVALSGPVHLEVTHPWEPEGAPDVRGYENLKSLKVFMFISVTRYLRALRQCLAMERLEVIVYDRDLDYNFYSPSNSSSTSFTVPFTLPNLRTLKITSFHASDVGPLLNHVRLPELRELYLTQNAEVITPNVWIPLGSFLSRSRPPLEYLVIGGVSCDGTSMPTSATTSNATATVTKWGEEEDWVAECMQMMPYLRSLNILNPLMSDAVIKALTRAPLTMDPTPELTTLVLHIDYSGSYDVVPLAKMILSRCQCEGESDLEEGLVFVQLRSASKKLLDKVMAYPGISTYTAQWLKIEHILVNAPKHSFSVPK